MVDLTEELLKLVPVPSAKELGTPARGHPVLHELLISIQSEALRKLKKPSAHEIQSLLKALRDDTICALILWVHLFCRIASRS